MWIVLKKENQKSIDSVLDAVVPAGCRRHHDDFSSDQFVFDAIAVFTVLFRKSEELLGGE